jgi:hypothetical protein
MKIKVKFGSMQLCKALKNLGFTAQKQFGSSHQKWLMPINRAAPTGLRPFIEVAHGRKQYFPPTVAGYLKQLKKLGFSEDEIITAFGK